MLLLSQSNSLDQLIRVGAGLILATGAALFEVLTESLVNSLLVIMSFDLSKAHHLTTSSVIKKPSD